ncbi:PAS domain-containing sensor histidine kinase [Sphingomonas sp. QA11]|uniref:sensor histidine kinase n=1 Tax=Sphingomonas sp. QA11 TaxID=2950605 RepID=UPI00234A7916|nr:PAS domain-containing sensor histidine kinase [Sphingomonas sp. QA11]WCM28243.1 PAS domain-containing sensor histidine kinase [Sphingomonas sp. QA11]
MNVTDPMLPPVRGLVDRAGRLVEADQRLMDLNLRAGGGIGQPVAIPQIATLARLAQRLGILVSRGVVAADGDDDVELWVRAEPEARGVHLMITGWRSRAAWYPEAMQGEREGDFLRSAADWSWETDSALRVTFLSISAGTKHGFDAAAMLGQPLTRLFALGEDQEGSFPILGGLAMHQRFDGQSATLRATGRPLRLSATPRTDAGGAFAGFIGAAHMIDDVTDGAPVAAHRPEPEEVPEDLTDAFAARLDQALRSPLGRIIANADSINAQSEGPLRQDYADYAADIASAGRHLMGLVDDLVDLQAIERPDFVVAKEPVDLADVARRAAGLLGVRASEAQVRIDKPAPQDMLPATGEFRRALQVLVNLIGNAVRYSPREGMVWIRTERENGVAAVIVADQGKGIAPADQARIFEKFERVDPREPGGSGLGLYIARRLARAMGGDVTVDSAPGQGARFVFTLPYRD